MYICAVYNENIMLGSQTESHYCNMFSCHLPHTVLFVSCDVFHIVVAVGYSQKGKKKNPDRKEHFDQTWTKYTQRSMANVEI